MAKNQVNILNILYVLGVVVLIGGVFFYGLIYGIVGALIIWLFAGVYKKYMSP